MYIRSVSIELIYYRLSAFCALSKLGETLRRGKDSLMFKKKNDGNGEKIFRYSIRKYHFGAASVAVAALMFFANGVQAQAPAVSSATASDVVAGSAGNSDGEPQESDEGERKETVLEQPAEGKPADEIKAQDAKAEEGSREESEAEVKSSQPETKIDDKEETPQVAEEKKQEESDPVADTSAAKSIKGSLEALLEKLTLSSMKALHDEVESRLAAAKAVLDDPNATQAQVDEQVKLMEDLTRRVKEALSPQVSTPTVLEKAGLTNTTLTAPEGTVLTPKEAVTKVLEKNPVASTNGEVRTPSTKLSKSEVSDNQNKEKLKTISKYLSAYLIQANEITRPETKKLLEGVEEVVKSIEASVSQPQLTPTEIEELLKKGKQAEKKLFLAISRENSGKRDLLNGKPMKQGSYLRATPAVLNTKRAYIVRKEDGIGLPAETYLYAMKRRQSEKPTDKNLVPVSDAVNEAKITVTNLGNGDFQWDLTFNSKEENHQNAFYWFTLPKGHIITQTLAVTRTHGGHTNSSVNGSRSFNEEWGESIKETIQAGKATYGSAVGPTDFDNNFKSLTDVTNTTFLAKSGQSQRVGDNPTDSRNSDGYYYLGPTQDRFHRWSYSAAVSQEFYEKSKKIIEGLKQNTDLLYYFTLSNGKIQLSYKTHTNTPYAPIYYGAGMRSLENNEALMYFMARGLQEKPNAPTVTSSDEGTVTVTPYQNSDSDQNKNVDKVELSYTNAKGESKTAILKRDAGNGKWSSNDTGIKVLGNSFIVKQGTAKVGTQVKAKSYYGNSDPSDERQVPVPTAIPQNKKYNPTPKKQTVSRGETPVAKNSVNTDNLPNDTTYEWKPGNKPDTNTSKTNPPGDKAGVVVVTYPDGTTNEVNVTVKVTGQDFTPVKPTDKVPVKDKAHLTPEEKKQVADKVKAKKPGKEVTVGDDGTATVTDPTTGITHTIPGSELVNQVPNNDDNSSNDEKPDQGMVPRPNPTPTPRPDNGANTNNGGTTTPADSNSNSVTPDNSDNTPAPSVTTDDSSNTTPATSSSTVGQAQASTPAHSEDSTNQATAPSAQQRGAGNATAPESSRGLSGSSVMAPARSRRSVAFAGGAQSSQEKQVDKSVLRDLIQDLETRLKDLDGIDQSVIDAAKLILGEGQEALRNADLTEAGLREMTAKIKEALESLKGKQATKDEEEMQETRKEQGHLPYGTMIASLLALLGLLLFLIARRKKESELKKLTKELTKVLQESDLTNVDAKALDQAREALAQAVAFLANEKESDHTEDELIEKLKAILAQLR